MTEANMAETFEKEVLLKQEVQKQLEIKKIIKQEQNSELQKNLQVFVNLNNEERLLR